MIPTDLTKFDNSWYHPGRNKLIQILWYFTNVVFLKSSWLPVSGFKVALLRMFGAKIGKQVNIKPSVNIKYPWRLSVGDYSWIGENVWIDNLDQVTIGKNCCISQGALLLCGNHDYKAEAFDLITGPIILEDEVWIGANATVCPGVTCHYRSILSVGSVASKDLEKASIYRGNPAEIVRRRDEETK
jgi:putative colanic acid biosynthesis acetyltransferase WcaF